MLVTASANSLPCGSRLQSVSQPLTLPLAAMGADNHITEGVGSSCPAQELPRAMREGKGCRQMKPVPRFHRHGDFWWKKVPQRIHSNAFTSHRRSWEQSLFLTTTLTVSPLYLLAPHRLQDDNRNNSNTGNPAVRLTRPAVSEKVHFYTSASKEKVRLPLKLRHSVLWDVWIGRPCLLSL